MTEPKPADEDVPELGDAPATTIAAAALGVAPLPFLAVYAVLFIVHGSINPVVPPDITTTKHGELVAGLIALGLFIVGALSVAWLLNARFRLLFILGQAATLATSIDFISDSTTGSPEIPILLAVTSGAALVLCLLPPSLRYRRHRRRRTS